ncbi:glycosyltransferase family 4 protein [Caldivirga maquilingensis]|nr:glycosyltransferase family 4 protein [Caldivirga maquilingensis]
MAKLVPILRRVRPWFVLTYYYPALLPLLYLLGRVLNYYVVVKMDWDGNLTGNFLKVLFRKLMLIALSRFADAVIIESYDAMRKAIEAIPALRGKLRVVYNGWCDELLREFNLGNRERIVLTVARVVRVKGIHDLIRAFAMVANKHKDWVLRIVGPIVDANYYRELMTLVRQHNLEGRVYFLGAISDKELIREYSKASIFVLPSYAESFGIARLEALAHGLPVITTDTGGSEVVMGVGVIIEPGDVASLAYWLDRLMGDDALRYNMGMRARMKAAALTWRFVSTRIISIVNELESLRLKNKI